LIANNGSESVRIAELATAIYRILLPLIPRNPCCCIPLITNIAQRKYVLELNLTEIRYM